MYKFLITVLILASSIVVVADTKSDSLESSTGPASQYRHFYGRFDISVQEPITQGGFDFLPKTLGLGYNFTDMGARIEMRAGAESGMVAINHMSLGIYGYKDFFITDNLSLFAGGGYTANCFYTPTEITDEIKASDLLKVYKGEISPTMSFPSARLDLGMSYQTTENSTLEFSLFRKFTLNKDMQKMKEELIKMIFNKEEGSKAIDELTNWGINLGIRFKF